MEKFMFLFRGSSVYQPGQSPEALQALTEKMMNWVGDLIERGIHVSSQPLQTTGVQVSGAGKTLIDTPYGEHAAIVGGLTIIQAGNIAQAVKIAETCPILATDANIEIRPLKNL